MSVVPITSPDLDAAEVSWFSALCSDDYQFLGVPDGDLRSSWAHCSDIVKEAEAQGFRNILCPSSYQVGQDTLSFVAGCAPITEKINLLAAVRCGEVQPIMLARTIATLDHMLKGRLTVNIISSDFPGRKGGKHLSLPALPRGRRNSQAGMDPRRDQSTRAKSIPSKVSPLIRSSPIQNGGPLLYFGGYSPDALDLCGQHCDVYLMWPEPMEQLAGRMKAVNAVLRNTIARWTTACGCT